MSQSRTELGRQGEALAESYLLQKGFQIIGRNVRLPQGRGELDLVATDAETLVFVEVKTRTSRTFGTPSESITWRKQRKLRELALMYLQQQERPVRSFRFDVIAIQYHNRSEAPEIEHIPHAF